MSGKSNAFLGVLVLAAFVGTLAGCQKEGPAERAGKEIDGAVKKLTKQTGLAEPALRDAVFDAAR